MAIAPTTAAVAATVAAIDGIMNTFGKNIRLTTFGESHGPAVGGVIDGFPSGFRIDFDALSRILAERRPAHRAEPDKVEFLSGILDGVTLGTPIAFMIRNVDARPEDYDNLRHTYRPSHADIAYDMRYGIRDYRGGGRASGRETLSRVVAGALAMQWLAEYNNVSIETSVVVPVVDIPEGDSAGGVVHCSVKGMPAGKGNPVFGKVQASLAEAMLSIPACKGFQYGAGFAAASMLGSQHNDPMHYDADGTLVFDKNDAGGLLGGITTGQEIYFDVAFKPTPSISIPQTTVTDDGRNTSLTVNGRHDRCIAHRAAVVVRAMTALVLMDYCL